MTEKEFNKEYKRLFLPLGMYALRMTGDIGEAHDLVNQVFCAVWEKIRDGYEPADFKAYMYRSVHNKALGYIEKTGKYVDIEEAYVGEESTEEDVDVSERDARLWQAVDALPPCCREVFLMSKRDGLSHKEIAAELSISEKTVENHITKAFKKLREAYKGRH